METTKADNTSTNIAITRHDSFVINRDVVRITNKTSFGPDGVEKNFVEVFVDGQSFLTMDADNIDTLITRLQAAKQSMLLG